MSKLSIDKHSAALAFSWIGQFMAVPCSLYFLFNRSQFPWYTTPAVFATGCTLWAITSTMAERVHDSGNSVFPVLVMLISWMIGIAMAVGHIL